MAVSCDRVGQLQNPIGEKEAKRVKFETKLANEWDLSNFFGHSCPISGVRFSLLRIILQLVDAVAVEVQMLAEEDDGFRRKLQKIAGANRTQIVVCPFRFVPSSAAL